MKAKYLRTDPPESTSIHDTDTITLYFDNRPTDVKITKASEEITKAIVRGNTVEISNTHPGGKPYIHFTVTWRDGKKRLEYPNRDPAYREAKFLRADPPDRSSIIGVNTVILYFHDIPIDFKIRKSTSKSIGAPIVKDNTVEIPITHPIREPTIGF